MKIIIEADDNVILAARAAEFALKHRATRPSKNPWMLVSTDGATALGVHDETRAVRFNKASVRVYKPQVKPP